MSDELRVRAVLDALLESRKDNAETLEWVTEDLDPGHHRRVTNRLTSCDKVDLDAIEDVVRTSAAMRVYYDAFYAVTESVDALRESGAALVLADAVKPVVTLAYSFSYDHYISGLNDVAECARADAWSNVRDICMFAMLGLDPAMKSPADGVFEAGVLRNGGVELPTWVPDDAVVGWQSVAVVVTGDGSPKVAVHATEFRSRDGRTAYWLTPKAVRDCVDFVF